jgi:hypothetical protein
MEKESENTLMLNPSIKAKQTNVAIMLMNMTEYNIARDSHLKHTTPGTTRRTALQTLCDQINISFNPLKPKLV